MSDRRDHKAEPGTTRQGITLCKYCGERVREVYHRESGGFYWRHWRRS